jgi:hypothetical protein
VLPYLGPEIIAVIQTACSSSPNDSRSVPCLPYPGKSDDRIIPLMVSSFSLSCSKSKTEGVIKIWVCWRP